MQKRLAVHSGLRPLTRTEGENDHVQKRPTARRDVDGKKPWTTSVTAHGGSPSSVGSGRGYASHLQDQELLINNNNIYLQLRQAVGTPAPIELHTNQDV